MLLTKYPELWFCDFFLLSDGFGINNTQSPGLSLTQPACSLHQLLLLLLWGPLAFKATFYSNASGYGGGIKTDCFFILLLLLLPPLSFRLPLSFLSHLSSSSPRERAGTSQLSILLLCLPPATLSQWAWHSLLLLLIKYQSSIQDTPAFFSWSLLPPSWIIRGLIAGK